MRLMATYFRTGAGAARIMNIVQRKLWKLWRPGEMSDQDKTRAHKQASAQIDSGQTRKERSCQ